jgi:hypothetical protein
MESIKEFWATGIGKVIITGILGSTLLVCVLLGLVLIRNNTPESQSDPEQDLSSLQTLAAETALASRPTDIATPTEMPSPTGTSVPNTRASTGASSSTGSSDTNTNPYLNNVNVRFKDYQSAFSEVDGYFQESTADASVLLDDNWKQNANTALNRLDDSADQLENIGDAPPEYEELDSNLTSIASETHKLVKNYGDGIDQLDPSAINEAADNLNNIASSMNDVAQELNQLNLP